MFDLGKNQKLTKSFKRQIIGSLSSTQLVLIDLNGMEWAVSGGHDLPDSGRRTTVSLGFTSPLSDDYAVHIISSLNPLHSKKSSTVYRFIARLNCIRLSRFEAYSIRLVLEGYAAGMCVIRYLASLC